MARKPELNERDLLELATYLANPEVDTVIHAEMKREKCDEFEIIYGAATNHYPLPQRGQSPYILLHPQADKYGIQLRIYHELLPNAPQVVRDECRIIRRRTSGIHRARINGYNIVKQILECGFVLGENNPPSIQARIQNTMGGKFS